MGISAGTLWWLGVRLSVEMRRRYLVLGAALLTVGLLGAYGALALLVEASGGGFRGVAGIMLFIVAAGALATAYRFRLRWPLLLGLLFFFHAVGSWHAYGGHGAYFAGIADKRLMAIVALIAVGVGVYHESKLEEERLARHAGFGSLYLVFGLLYLNLSLWWLTLPRPTLVTVLLFAAATIGQIVAGGALKDSRFIGFGVVFLSINLYTRFFEHFWDRMSAGSFFALAGLVAVGLGFVFERPGSRPGAGA